MLKVAEKIQELFSPILERQEIDFVDLEIRGSAENLVIKVFVDVPGGIKIKKCAEMSSELRDALEIASIIYGNDFRLEVSSPGLDRPLKSSRDFFRNIGRYVELTFVQEIQGKNKITGEIASAGENKIAIRLENNEFFELPLKKLKRAMLKIKWS